MAVGWSRDGSVQEQIDATVESRIQLAKSQLPGGESLTHCAVCKIAIPEERRNAMPGVRYCVRCQLELETKPKTVEPLL
jgi:RNA polymerase-binding transcription factor DksA